MHKIAFAISTVGAILVAALAAMPAVAATPVSVKMTLTEPLKAGWPRSAPCPWETERAAGPPVKAGPRG
jgi:hypothetical protein